MATHSFQKPNLESQTSVMGEPFLSIRSDASTLGLSTRAQEVMDAEIGDYLHTALDRTRTPWIGVVSDRTEQGEPQMRDGGNEDIVLGSRLLARHLADAVGVKLGDSHRLFFTGDTAEDPETGTTLYELETR